MTYEEVIFKFAEKKEAEHPQRAPIIPGSVRLATDMDCGYSTYTPGEGAYHELFYKVEDANGRSRERSLILGNDLPLLLKDLLEIALPYENFRE